MRNQDPRNSTAGLWEKPKLTKSQTQVPGKEYLRNTTFHGLKELILPMPIGFKAAWALVVLITLVCMMYQIGNIIDDYQAGATVTKLTTNSLNSTPPLLFCLPEGFDYWKAQDMGIHEWVLHYIWGFLLALYDDDEDGDDDEYTEQELTFVRTGYGHILNNANGSLSKLIKEISINTNADYISFNFHCSKCKVQPLSTLKVLATGVCHFFEPAPFESSLGILGETPQIEINLDISNFSGGSNQSNYQKLVRNPYSGKFVTPDFTNYYYPNEEMVAMLEFTFGFGDQAYQAVGSYSNGLTLNVGRNYDIFLTTFVNQKLYGCNKELTEPKDCRAGCIKRSIALCSNNTCNAFVSEADDEPHKNYCNRYDTHWGSFNHTCAINHYQACIEEPCPIPCLSQTYQTSIFPGLPNGKMTSRVIVRSMGANAVIYLQDVEKYTFVSFVSDFGGLIGLFCGGSFISLCHLLYYAVITLYRKDEKSAVEDGDQNKPCIPICRVRQSISIPPPDQEKSTKMEQNLNVRLYHRSTHEAYCMAPYIA